MHLKRQSLEGVESAAQILKRFQQNINRVCKNIRNMIVRSVFASTLTPHYLHPS